MSRHKRSRIEEGAARVEISNGSHPQKRQKLENVGRRVTALHEDDTQILGETSRIDGHPTPTTKSLFVRGLPRTVTSEQLAGIFSQSSPIKHAFVVKEPSSTQSKGYGFVTFADSIDAERARQALGGSLVANQKIMVEHADSRHRGLLEVKDQQPNEESVPAKRPPNQRSWVPEGAEQPTKLIVRNLPWTISNVGQLSSLFQSFGKIKQATMPRAKSGLSSGFGFIMLRGRKNAETAMKVMNGKEVDGRVLAVDWSIPKFKWQESQVTKGDTPDQVRSPYIPPTEATGDQPSGDSSSDEVLTNYNNSNDGDNESGFTETSELLRKDEKGTSVGERRSNEPSTLFVRNVSFITTEEALISQFSTFGKVRYARIVRERASGRPKGTAFVRFNSPVDADKCLKNAPLAYPLAGRRKVSNTTTGAYAQKESILQDTGADTSGLYTLDGRVLQVSAAVDSSEALRIATARHSAHEQQDVDKRRLYLLSEGAVSPTDPLYNKLSQSEIQLREDSLKQRQALLKSNPGLHLSLTRLSIRNLPRNVSSKSLKALARQAVVGFAEDVKAGRRDPMSKEEMRRGGIEDKQAEKVRRAKGKGLVKQAKIVFESKEGSKVDEKSKAGRSRGYGFVEYHSHRAALMGLRWLNGHEIEPSGGVSDSSEPTKAAIQEQRKRPIVEFAIENLQVINRRHGREMRAQQSVNSMSLHTARHPTESDESSPKVQQAGSSLQQTSSEQRGEALNRQAIIGRKRMQRKFRGIHM